ncbi:MAG: BON domain-containing protein [Longimicrobiales bacterium]
MDKPVQLLVGMAIGAGLMYAFDPDRGRRRRALVKDTVVHGRAELRDLRQAADARMRDARNRIEGVMAEAQARRFETEPPADAVLEARVRSEIGRVVSNPGTIDVTAQEGRVSIGGPVLAQEVDELRARIRSVRGVTEVDDQLDVRESPEDVPGLRGA